MQRAYIFVFVISIECNIDVIEFLFTFLTALAHKDKNDILIALLGEEMAQLLLGEGVDDASSMNTVLLIKILL